MPGYALVVGEALVDLIESRDSTGGISYQPRYGGSPLNVAVGATRLGTKVKFATALGSDSFGSQLRVFLEAEGVTLVVTPDRQLRTCLAVASRRDSTVSYEYFGDTEALLEIPHVAIELAEGATVIHAGSTALYGGPAQRTVQQLFAAVAPIKTLDPNPRPRLIRDRASYARQLEDLVASADLVKMSREDVHFLAPDVDVDAFVEQMLALGPRAVIVTGAGEATVVATTTGRVDVAVPRVSAVDFTGAGDSFMASMLTDLCQSGLPQDLTAWEALAKRANIAASITCTAVGGASAMPTSSQLAERLTSAVPQMSA